MKITTTIIALAAIETQAVNLQESAVQAAEESLNANLAQYLASSAEAALLIADSFDGDSGRIDGGFE